MLFTIGVVLVILKLVGVISWSWWIVSLPFWAGIAWILAVYFGVAVIALIVAGVATAWDAFASLFRPRNRRR